MVKDVVAFGFGAFASDPLLVVTLGFSIGGAPEPALTGNLPSRSRAAALGAWVPSGTLPARGLVGTLPEDG